MLLAVGSRVGYATREDDPMNLGYLGFDGGRGSAYGAAPEDPAIKALNKQIRQLEAQLVLAQQSGNQRAIPMIRASIKALKDRKKAIKLPTITGHYSVELPVPSSRLSSMPGPNSALSSTAPGLPPWLVAAMKDRAMNKNSMTKPPSTAKASIPLDATTSFVPETTSPGPVPTPDDPNRKWWIIGGIVAAIAGIGGAFALGRRGGAKPAPRSAFATAGG